MKNQPGKSLSWLREGGLAGQKRVRIDRGMVPAQTPLPIARYLPGLYFPKYCFELPEGSSPGFQEQGGLNGVIWF